LIRREIMRKVYSLGVNWFPKSKKTFILLALALVTVLCLHSGSAEAVITDGTPPDRFTSYYYHIDAMGGPYDFISENWLYASGGFPAQLVVKAHLNGHFTGNNYTEQTVGCDKSTTYRIQPRAELPPGFTGNVPYRFDIAIEGSMSGNDWGYIWGVVAQVGGQGFSSWHQGPYSVYSDIWWKGTDLRFSNSFSGSAPVGSDILTRLAANMRMSVGGTRWIEGEIIVDPYVYIDPSWKYASYFMVTQAPGPNDNGVWTEVFNPNAAAPLPGTVLLLFTGLGCLSLFRRRK
jgi:hypothetical protein